MDQPDEQPTPAPPRAGPGRPALMTGGRARSLALDSALWARVPVPRSPFTQAALEAYLEAPEARTPGQPLKGPDGRFQPAPDAPARRMTGVYLTDALYERLIALPGPRAPHVEAALRAALDRA
jgi:hypothetical protein